MKNQKQNSKIYKKGIRLLSNNLELKNFMDLYFTNFFKSIANEYQLNYEPIKAQKLNYIKFNYQPFDKVFHKNKAHYNMV